MGSERGGGKEEPLPFSLSVFSAPHVCSELSPSTPTSRIGVLPYPGCLFWLLEEVRTEKSASADIIFEAAGLDRNSERGTGFQIPDAARHLHPGGLREGLPQRAAELRLRLCKLSRPFSSPAMCSLCAKH